MGRLIAAVVLACAALGCRARADEVRLEAALRELVRQRMPGIEQATGLTFRETPRVARRTRDQMRDYIMHKLDTEYPPAEFAAIQASYRLFGLVPDTLDLRATMLKLLGEQVAGYYDPDSATLFVIADVDSFMLRTTLSHELVHALQDQYVPVDSLLRRKRQNDRSLAAQAVLEGQATLAQTLAMMPELRRADLPSFWEQRSAVTQQQSQMKEYALAPLWLREMLVFPYLAGADFVRWYEQTHPGQHPYGRALPQSTEQILHTDRYSANDAPTALRFVAPSADSVRYEDELGEFETRLMFQVRLGDPSGLRATALASGWDGDRYQLLGADEQALALVWYSVWDDQAAAERFRRSLERAWLAQRTGRSVKIEGVTIDGRPGVRLVDAPVNWAGWKGLPQVKVSPDQ